VSKGMLDQKFVPFIETPDHKADEPAGAGASR
jgi:hypothetical protein